MSSRQYWGVPRKLIGRTTFPNWNLALEIKSLEKMQLGDGLIAGSYLDSKRRVLVDFIGLVVEIDHEKSTARVIWTPKSVRLQISEHEMDANSWNGLRLFIIEEREIQTVQFTMLFSELIDKHDIQKELTNHDVSSAKITNGISTHRVEDPGSTVDMLAEAIFWVLHSSKIVMDVQEIAKTVNANRGIVRHLLMRNNLSLFKQTENFASANWARKWSSNWTVVDNRVPLSGENFEDYIKSREYSNESFKSILIGYFLNIENSVKVAKISKDLNVFAEKIELFLDLDENQQVFRKFGADHYQLKDFRIHLGQEKMGRQNIAIQKTNVATHEKIPQVNQNRFINRKIDTTNLAGDFSSFFMISNRSDKMGSLERKIEEILSSVLGKTFLTLELEAIKDRGCPLCDKELTHFETYSSIFCSQKCLKSAEQNFLKQLTNYSKLKFTNTDLPNQIAGVSVAGNVAEISLGKIQEMIIDWLSPEPIENNRDSAIWSLIDNYKLGNITFVEGIEVEGLTVLNPEFMTHLKNVDKKGYLGETYDLPIPTDEVVALLSNYSKEVEVSKHIRLINDKKFLTSKRFIDRFTLCYFGASPEILEAVGEKIFLDTDRLKSWIFYTFKENSDEFAIFADELCFAMASLDVWPNMAILIHPWLNYPAPLTAADSSQRKYLARLILSITRENSKCKHELLNWLRELVYLNFEIDAPKTIRARRKYSETFKVSRERARQISLAIQPLIDYLRESEIEKYDIDFLKVKDRLSKYIRLHPGSKQDELVKLFGIDTSLWKWFDLNFGHLVLIPSDPSFDSEIQLKRVDVLDSLRAASTLYWPLTSKKYGEAINMGFVSGVSMPRILQIFGTWKNACDEAGVECGEPLREEYTRDFSRDECIKYAGDYLMDEQSNGTASGYISWRENHQTPDRVPSFGTLRNRIDRYWTAIVRTALEELRNQWVDADLEESINGH